MSSTTPERASAARDRLVAAADELFYRQGIHAVGVDRIVAKAGVTLATFYRHFASKEALVEAYLDLEDAGIQQMFSAAAETGASGDELLTMLIEGLGEDIERHHDRGCPFINAAAEYPDPESPVRRIVARHRRWFRDELETAVRLAGVETPAKVAARLVLLRDAAMVGGYLDGVELVRPAFLEAARAAAAISG